MGRLIKIKASTLIETIIALLIVTLAFSLAMIIFLNISRNNNNTIKTKAYFLTDQLFVKTKTEKLFVNEEFDYGNIVIHKSVLETDESDELFLLKFTARDFNNHLLLERNEWVIIE